VTAGLIAFALVVRHHRPTPILDQLRSGHTECGLPQRTETAVRCGRPRSVWPDLYTANNSNFTKSTLLI